MAFEIVLKDEFIKLGQALKAAPICMSGGEAKEMILSGNVLVNGEVETRRGRKLYGGDTVKVSGEEILIREEQGSVE